MTALDPIRRPNGKLYRPRNVIAYEVDGEDGIAEGVLVLGTHDQIRAKPLADQLAQYLLGSGYVTVQPETGWWRDGMEMGQRRWVSDEVHGRAGVLYREIVETSEAWDRKSPEFRERQGEDEDEPQTDEARDAEAERWAERRTAR